MPARYDRAQITNWLTVGIIGVWLATAVVRLFMPWPEAKIIDDLMPVVGSFWFISVAVNGKPKNGLVA